MKYRLLIYFLISSKLIGWSQPVSGIITYKQLANYDRFDTVKMYFNQENSFYVSNRGEKQKINKLANGEILNTSDPKIFAEQTANHKMIYRYFIDEEGDIVYKNWGKNKLIFRLVLEHEPIIVEEPELPKLEWILGNEFKKIGNFNCQMAQTQFRGRKYIAWFTPEIPVPTGPWKLHGLPGLILEAYDETETFRYFFQSIEMPLKNTEELTKLPKKGDRVPFAAYMQTVKDRKEDRDRRAASKAAQRGTQLTFYLDPNYKEQEIY